MSIWPFLRDSWRAVAFFAGGLALVIAVLKLDSSAAGYAAGLGFFMMVLYLVVEYAVRRPFYRNALHRLKGDASLTEAGAPLTAGTEEQRLLADLLHKYQYSMVSEVQAVEEKRKFYELFVTRFAHQMKTPLTVIQLLENELRNGAPQELSQLADSIGEERARLHQALDMMLSTARLNAFSFDAQMESLDLLVLLRGVVNEHKASWIRQRLFPKIECAEASVIVQSDQKWLSFLCDQIVRNAIQYGGKEGSASFVIRVVKENGEVLVEFIDQGIGIPAQDIRRVFDPFYTGANGRTHSRATGMGLYLVREVAQRLGHRVAIRSVEGQGTTVEVRLAGSAYYAR